MLKIWTTNSWWIFGILALAFTGIALLINLLQADYEIGFAQDQQDQPPPNFGAVGPDGQPLPADQGGIPPEELLETRGW